MKTVESFKLPQEKPVWAIYGSVYLKWVRSVADKCDIDAEKYALGFTLFNIIGDDSKSFGAGFWEYLEVLRDVYPSLKSNLIKKMTWESQVQELPEEIRLGMYDFLPRLIQSDWGVEEEFIAMRDEWTEDIRNYTEELIKENSCYKEAVVYEAELQKVFIEEWGDVTRGWRE